MATQDPNSAAIFHVVGGEWEEGRDLLPLADLFGWGDDVASIIEERWPDFDVATYYQTEAQFVHCHATLLAAQDFAEEFGGKILSISVEALEEHSIQVEEGAEYPHPVIRGRIPADAISRLPADDQKEGATS